MKRNNTADRSDRARLLHRSGLALATALLLAACAPQKTESLQSGSTLPAEAESRAAAQLETLKNTPAALRPFLTAFPKGGDIHSHLAGAVYAESMLEWAAEDGRCGNAEAGYLSLALPSGKCDSAKGDKPVSELLTNANDTDALIDALSTRNYHWGSVNGHDQFFNTFGKFWPANINRTGDMLAEVAERAASQNIPYLELMDSPGMTAARSLGAKVGWHDDPRAFRKALRAGGMAQIVTDARQEITRAEARKAELLSCDTSSPKAGCDVTIRYLAQVIRTFPREEIFAQTLLAHELVRQDSRFVGLNFVAPEDDRITLRDYSLQMQIIGELGRMIPDVPVTLHAGELTIGLVPPEDLRFHIREAIEVAGATRIGHGVDILYEDGAQDLMARMAKDEILVEINLTSNEVILEVEGEDHPFTSYRAAGVPLTLSTDDEGVSRIDLTHEYEKAVRTYDLDYGFLKELSRNSLTYSFLEGENLWLSPRDDLSVAACQDDQPGAADPSAACQGFLKSSKKARLQWDLEARFLAFEASF
ncbi:adenosine deaminase family protein [Rhodovibrionaceae bacterium A322]